MRVYHRLKPSSNPWVLYFVQNLLHHTLCTDYTIEYTILYYRLFEVHVVINTESKTLWTLTFIYYLACYHEKFFIIFLGQIFPIVFLIVSGKNTIDIRENVNSPVIVTALVNLILSQLL